MELYRQSILFIADIIIGEKIGLNRRGYAETAHFCHKVGLMEYVHGSSRKNFLKEALPKLNNTPKLDKIILALLDNEEFAYGDCKPEDTIAALNEILEKNNYKIIGSNGKYKIASISANNIEPHKNLKDFEHLEEFVNGAKESLERGDYWETITKARTIIEITLKEICGQKNIPYIDNGLIKCFKDVQKVLKMDGPDYDYPDFIEQLIKSTANIVNKLAHARNESSSSHAPNYKPKKHHAQFILEQAISLMNFLISVMGFQKNNGF